MNLLDLDSNSTRLRDICFRGPGLHKSYFVAVDVVLYVLGKALCKLSVSFRVSAAIGTSSPNPYPPE
jgi:hypothetical protein